MITNTRLEIIAKKIGLSVERVHAYEERCIAAGITKIDWDLVDTLDVVGLPYYDKDGNLQYAESIV